MATIDEVIDTLGQSDLEYTPAGVSQEAFFDIATDKAVKWIAKRIAKGMSDHQIADLANSKLTDLGISGAGANPVKALAHVRPIRAARARRLKELAAPPE